MTWLLRLLGFRRTRRIDTTPTWRGVPREASPQPYEWTPAIAAKLKGFNQ